MKKLMVYVAVAMLMVAFMSGCISGGADIKTTTTLSKALEKKNTVKEKNTTKVTPKVTPKETKAPVTILVGENKDLGKYLTTDRGRALYVSLRDKEGVSTCYGNCTQRWIPVTAAGKIVAGEGITGRLETINRRDGSKQVTYNGMPLYMFQKDGRVSIRGQGSGSTWYIVSPEEGPIKKLIPRNVTNSNSTLVRKPGPGATTTTMVKATTTTAAAATATTVAAPATTTLKATTTTVAKPTTTTIKN